MAFTYDNLVRTVGDGAATINAELAAQNAADYVASQLQFDGAGNAVLLLTKNPAPTVAATLPQKVNVVGITQGDLDTDTAAEAEDGWVPTGVFVNVAGPVLYVLYQQLNEIVAP